MRPVEFFNEKTTQNHKRVDVISKYADLDKDQAEEYALRYAQYESTYFERVKSLIAADREERKSRNRSSSRGRASRAQF